TTSELEDLFKVRPIRIVTPLQPPPGAEAIEFGVKEGRNFAPERTAGENVFEAAARHASNLVSKGRRVMFAAWTDGSAERLSHVLHDHNVKDLAPAGSWPAVEKQPAKTFSVCVLPLEHGFETDQLAVISEQDILGDRLARPRRKRKAANIIMEASALSPGDLVVHIDHGVARYAGLMTLDVQGAPHDCLELHYAGGDKLFLPVENIELVSRYGSEDAGANLDKLGGVGWQTRKARATKRLKDMAEELIKIAAKRAARTAEPLSAPDGAFEEFSARFPFEETDDQLAAIKDVIDDLHDGKVMDRLICGDVGFGKTEVALRAAFMAAMSGRQVAVIAPTTLLARQHFNTFTERFRGLPVRIAQLSRLVAAKDAAETHRGLAAGEIEIVVGTHAVLAKDTKFRDLGLLIIDEEQHFGVKHKERLKELRSDVHVLTLSATPIPRTLQQAMSGIREMSIIATPPVDRLAVRTYVTAFDPVGVREALLREKHRGGQSFLVTPRVADLPDLEKFLTEYVPEVRFVVAHGQMAARDLEDIIGAFYEGKYDVLLSTTIVESGLDIPRANTLIINRADMFGLAQLYQLRGRVGRSKVRAYAYLMTPADHAVTAGAERRLKILQSLDGLGAGFTLASHDLDLRGGGNLLGEEQSGHIREVGVELYQSMLEEAVASLKGDDTVADRSWSPQIAVGASVLIPEAYVPDLTVRLSLYRRLGELESSAELDGYAAELVDRFGSLPEEAEHLISVAGLKILCRQLGVGKLDAGPKGAVMTFRDGGRVDPARIVGLVQSKPKDFKLRPDQKFVAMGEWPTPEERLKGVKVALEALSRAAMAKAA
ncbi:MAG: transcription-repair coupling factor, partial [Caulobacterales bacterium]